MIFEHVTGGNVAFFHGMDAALPSERASGWTGHIDEAVEKYGQQIVSDLWSAVYNTQTQRALVVFWSIITFVVMQKPHQKMIGLRYVLLTKMKTASVAKSRCGGRSYH